MLPKEKKNDAKLLASTESVYIEACRSFNSYESGVANAVTNELNSKVFNIAYVTLLLTTDVE